MPVGILTSSRRGRYLWGILQACAADRPFSSAQVRHYGADGTYRILAGLFRWWRRVVPRAFGVGSGHSPSAILSLPAFVSRSPPDNSCTYPRWISRSLCSAEIARCIKPLAQSRNETNSSWVNCGAGAIPRICAGFPSGRLTSSNMATWVLSNQDSITAPQTSQDT